MFTFERCSLFMILLKQWEKFGTEKKCSYFGGVHLLEVFTFGGFTVLQFHLHISFSTGLDQLGRYTSSGPPIFDHIQSDLVM